MRLPLIPILSLLIINLLIDLYIRRAVRLRVKRHNKFWVRFATLSSAILASIFIALICVPKRYGDNDALLWIMWALYAYMSVYIPKILFCAIDILSKIPELFKRKRLKWLSYAGVGIALLSFAGIWWGTSNRFNIDVKKLDVEIEGLPICFDGMTVAQISDFHVGSYGTSTHFAQKVVEHINELHPDLITFTGDIVNRHSIELAPFIEPLSQLRAPMGVYSVLGNHDYGDYYKWANEADKANDLERLKNMQAEMGWILLDNRTVMLYAGADSIALIGVENVGDPPFRIYGNLETAYPGNLADNTTKILLSHNPAHWTSKISDNDSINIALTLSGHTHAMQIEIGGWTPGKYRYPTWGGLYTDNNGHQMYVNIGLGEVAIPARIGATPEITILTLKKKMIDTSTAVAKRTGISIEKVSATIDLLDDGATVPFVSRYRKERTGGLDEVAIREIETTLRLVREIEKRRTFVLDAIETANALTPELRQKLESANDLTSIEDIYAPYKPKRRTRATIAREKGLDSLARIIMAGKTTDVANSAQRFVGKNDVSDENEAIAGASDIIAEWASENIRLRGILRRRFNSKCVVCASLVKGKEDDEAAEVYSNYFNFSRPLHQCSSHQYLALRRAEREGILKLKYELPHEDELIESLRYMFTPREATQACKDVIAAAVADSFRRLMRPSVENEIATEAKQRADKDAIEIFAANLKQLLLASPLQGKRILAIDPGYRTGCKVVCLDSQGNLLCDDIIYPTPPQKDLANAAATLRRLVSRHKIEVIAIGNGTASRETEQFVKDAQLVDTKQVYIVSENGASIYSASDVAREEFPDKDVTVRGAVSIGRRLIDPLAELVKIDPKSIGVGQYQHDVDQAALKDALDYTVMSCVNSVGINVNTASRQLLSYISGIGPQLANNIVAYRAENGDFASRQELKKVPRMGDKAFEQSAGFLRIPQGSNALDNTGIHPESYAVVTKIAKQLGVSADTLAANDELLDKVDIERLLEDKTIGRETLTDIIAELRKPGRDPRTETGDSEFNTNIESFDDLCEGMIVNGVVNNITAFGAFVNLGIKENGLLHISEISQRRVASVGQALRLGQKIRVKIIEIDDRRHRIGLSMKDLPTEK